MYNISGFSIPLYCELNVDTPDGKHGAFRDQGVQNPFCNKDEGIRIAKANFFNQFLCLNRRLAMLVIPKAYQLCDQPSSTDQ